MSRLDLVESLASDPASVLEVVKFLFAESGKAHPDEATISACSFLLERTLEAARWRKENQSSGANDLIDRVRNFALEAAADDNGGRAALLVIAQCFAAAKVDIGEGLRRAIAGTVQPAAASGDQETAFTKFANSLGRLAADLRHDPFLIHAEIYNLATSLSADRRTQMAAALPFFNVASVRESAAGWLLDTHSSSADAVLDSLVQAAAQGLVSQATRNRLSVMRHWVNGRQRAAMDSVAGSNRQSANGEAGSPPVQIIHMLASSCDGAGAQSFFVVAKQNRKFSFGSLLVKHGFGVRDAFVHTGMAKRDAEAFVDRIGLELSVYETSLDAIQMALRHGLAVNIESGEPIPFGLLQFIEFTGLSTVVPCGLKPEELLNRLIADIPAGKKDDASVARVLGQSKRWRNDFEWLDSWFEDSECALQAVRSGESKKARTEKVLHTSVSGQRQRWTELLAWTALAARDDPHSDEWIGFTLVARELLGERAIAEIPLATHIAQNTVEALSVRRF